MMKAIIGLVLAGGLLLGSPPALQFNASVPSRGLLMWEPIGGAFNGCTATPSSCYTGNGTTASQLPPAKLAVLTGAKIGHLRLSFDPSPLLSDPANDATYLTYLDSALTAVLGSGLKVVLNVAPNGNYTGWTPDDILDAGPSGTKFTAYLAVLQVIASHLAASPALCPPTTCAFGVFNETVPAGSVTGGINAQYQQLIAMFRAVRQLLPKQTISLCLTDFCDILQTTNFNGWQASDFDVNTLIEIHAYIPAVAAYSCNPNSIWRDLCGITSYPPANDAGVYATALAAYSVQLAADTTWAGDCTGTGIVTASATAGSMTVTGGAGTVRTWDTLSGTGINAGTYVSGGSGPYTIVGTTSFGSTTVTLTGGPNCTTAKASNYTELTGTFTAEGLAAYYGQGYQGANTPCQPTNSSQNGTWLQTCFGLVTTWLPSGVTAKQIYFAEGGNMGVGPNGTGLNATDQAVALGDWTAAVDHYGYSRATLEENYSVSGSGGSWFGLQNQNTPYAFINSAAITSLNFNGQ